MALLITLIVIVFSYISPARHWLQQSGTSKRQKEELSQLTTQRERLTRRLRALRDPGALSARHAAWGWSAWASAPT